MGIIASGLPQQLFGSDCIPFSRIAGVLTSVRIKLLDTQIRVAYGGKRV